MAKVKRIRKHSTHMGWSGCSRVVQLALAWVIVLVLGFIWGSGKAWADATAPCNVGGGANSTECGVNSTASGDNSTATGVSARASGTASTATGMDADATGNYSTATGWFAQATGDSSTATGVDAWASGVDSTALGRNAQAGFDNSVAIGVGVQTTRANQVGGGTGANTYTMPGATSAASRAAQTGEVEYVTSDAAGNLGTATAAAITAPFIDPLAEQVDDLEYRMDKVERRVDKLERRADDTDEGVAMAIAMGGAVPPGPGQLFAMAVNFGTFNGQNAAAMSGTIRVHRNICVTTGAGLGLGRGKYGGRVGVSIGW